MINIRLSGIDVLFKHVHLVTRIDLQGLHHFQCLFLGFQEDSHNHWRKLGCFYLKERQHNIQFDRIMGILLYG